MFNAELGTLKAAKKQNLVDFKGQMLLKGAHDNVVIYLVDANSAAGVNNNSSGDSSKPPNTATTTPETETPSEISCTKSSSSVNTESSLERDTEELQLQARDNVKDSDEHEKNIITSSEGIVDPCIDTDTSSNTKETGMYTLNELKTPGPYPSDVDVNSREQYLSPSEFLKLFQMNLSDFKASPKWKQDNMKKKHNLF